MSALSNKCANSSIIHFPLQQFIFTSITKRETIEEAELQGQVLAKRTCMFLFKNSTKLVSVREKEEREIKTTCVASISLGPYLSL